MHVEEQARVTACKVREVSFWHGADVAPDIFGQVLIMMFLMSKEKTQTGVSATGLVVRKRDNNKNGVGSWAGATYAPCSEARGGGPAPIARRTS